MEFIVTKKENDKIQTMEFAKDEAQLLNVVLWAIANIPQSKIMELLHLFLDIPDSQLIQK